MVFGDGWINALQITLSNGESCTGGSPLKASKSHTFDAKKKITRVEVIVINDEENILRINFYSG